MVGLKTHPTACYGLLLGALHPLGGGAERLCPVLLVEPGEAWLRRRSLWVAAFVDPSGCAARAGPGGVVGRGGGCGDFSL